MSEATGASEDRPSEDVLAAWRYLRSEFDGPALDSFEALGRHAPNVLAGYAQLREAAGQPSPPSELTTREKELILIAIGVTALKSDPPPVLHARKAVQAGATVGQVAEVVALCLSVAGMATYQSDGRFVIAAAEEAYRASK